MSKKYDKILFICRVQPVHNGHFAVIRQALQQTDNLIICVGSAYSARNITNPFTYEERVKLLKANLCDSELERITFKPQGDYPYNMDMWTANIIEHSDQQPNETVAVISSDKDGDDRLRREWFPFWDHITVKTEEYLNATDIRQILFSDKNVLDGDPDKLDLMRGFLSLRMPQNAIETMIDILISTYDDILESNIYEYLLNEWETARVRKEPYEQALAEKKIPYAVQHNTVDNVVICAGHVLVVRRKKFPGKNLWAIPGGFLEHDETTLEGALRELQEETKIDFPPKKLPLHIVGEKVFDHPKRSQVGRLITHAFFYQLPPQTVDANGKKIRANGGKPIIQRPSIEGADDVDKAVWMPIKEFLSLERYIHDDHKHIVEYFINKPSPLSFYK